MSLFDPKGVALFYQVIMKSMKHTLGVRDRSSRLTASEGCDEEMEEVTWKMVAGQGTFITETLRLEKLEPRVHALGRAW